MKLRSRFLSLAVVICLVAALFPFFIFSASAADVSRVNIFSLDWSCSVSSMPINSFATGEIMPGSPFTVHLSVPKKCVVYVMLDFGEPVFFSDQVYELSYFFNSLPNGSALGASPVMYFNLGADATLLPTTTTGNSLSGYKSSFTLDSGSGTYPNLKIRFQCSVDPGDYYLTLLDFDAVDSVRVSDGTMFSPYWEFDVDGSGDFSSEYGGFNVSVDVSQGAQIANNPQFQKFQGDTILKMYGGLNYCFFDGRFALDIDSDAPAWLSSASSDDYLYYDVSLFLPGTMVYIDVYNIDAGMNIPFDLCYYAPDTVQDVDISAGTLSQELTGSTLVPIGGSIAGGLVAVQPTGSSNVNYVLSTNYNGTGGSGNLDYSVDYGYRDTTYLDATTYEYDSLSSFVKVSRVNLRFKLPGDAVVNQSVYIHFVCMDNIYVNYERSFTTAGILNYNSGSRDFGASIRVTDAVDSNLVSFDAEYLGKKMDKNTDEVLAFLQRFYPSSKSIVEFNSTLSGLNSSRDTMDGYQSEMQGSLSADFKRLPTFDTSVANYANAMIFVSSIANSIATSMRGFTGIIAIPILLGFFFFILQRASGVTRIGRGSRHSDGSDKGGDSS